MTATSMNVRPDDRRGHQQHRSQQPAVFRIGLIALALSVSGLWIDRPMFAACWLAAWWWSAGLVLGSHVLLWMHRLTGGKWGDALKPAVEAAARRMPFIVLLSLPIAFMLRDLYPWAQDPDGWTQGIARPAFVHFWLSTGPFLVRMLVYAAAWCWLVRAHSATMRSGRAALSLVLYVVLTSLAAVDLLASLVPAWSSSVFGLLTLTSQLFGGSALVVGCTAWLAHARREPQQTRPFEPPVWRDFGNLLLMGASLWGYLSFMQFLIIWAENLPREISWFVPRLQTGWHGVGVAVVAGNLAVPLVALLFRSIKDRPVRLAALALWVLVAQALDAVWMVLPSVDAHSLHGWWLAPLVFIGFALSLFGGLPRELWLRRETADGQ